ncbi:MAG: type 2 lantipeptide synthetase LanM, partial [Kamptonema sp. SIO4C4]|nr:type 2 lantipeptide synthetase LanM [Kamptonema sp. SIO4C4]
MTEFPHPVNPDCPHWYRGLPLGERLQHVETIEAVDGVGGDRRKQGWQAQTPLTNPELYDKKLEQIGLTPEQWSKILGETAASLASRCPSPPWLEQLHRAFARSDCSNIQIAPVEELSDEQASLGFLQSVKPLCSDAIARLEQGIETLSQTTPHLPFNPQKIKGILFAPVPEMLGSMLAQTMVLELHVARLQGQLSGATPKARLGSFMQQLANPERAVSLLQEYPVLARQLAVTLEQWVESSLECLQRLCSDWGDLCTHYQTEPGELVKVHQGAGDRHRGGRSVAILEFSSGFKLVYKPKSLAIDVHLQDLLAWLNQQGLKPAFPLLNILNRERYGWVEFISAETCHETEEIERFYERVGEYLALMYVLEATDFHLENLIAVGEYPVLIDLETLFRPEILDPDAPESRLIANQKMGRSVMSVGLLPQRTGVKAGTGLDLSGIGAVGEQTLPNRRLQLAGVGSDTMHLDRQPGTLAATHNRPHLNGKPVQGWQYRESILQGFTRLYRLLWEKR